MGTVANGALVDTATAGSKTFSVTATDGAGNTTTVTHTYGVTAVLPEVLTPDTVGVVNIDKAKWYLSSKAGAVTSFDYGNPGDLPVSSDWDNNPTSTPGPYRSEDSGGLPGGFFYYARNSNSTGIADDACFGGNPSDIPISGDSPSPLECPPLSDRLRRCGEHPQRRRTQRYPK